MHSMNQGRGSDERIGEGYPVGNMNRGRCAGDRSLNRAHSAIEARPDDVFEPSPQVCPLVRVGPLGSQDSGLQLVN
jgi:hypothetical protein